MTLFTVLKTNAKRALRGNWGKAIGVLAIWYAFVFLLSMIQQYALNLFSGPSPFDGGAAFSFRELLLYQSSVSETVVMAVFLLLNILLGVPLQMGVLNWYYRLVRGTSQPVSEIFGFFESFKVYCKTIWLFISLFVRAILWGAAFLLLPSAMYFLSLNVVNGRYGVIAGNPRITSAVGAMGLTISVVLMLLAVVLYCIFMNRYALAVYLYFDDPGIKVAKALKLSVSYTKEYRSSLFLYSLTFTGWFLLCLFIVPVLYVAPYYSTAMSLYSRYIIEKNILAAGEATQEFRMTGLARRQENLSGTENVPEGDLEHGAPPPRTEEIPPEGIVPDANNRFEEEAEPLTGGPMAFPRNALFSSRQAEAAESSPSGELDGGSSTPEHTPGGSVSAVPPDTAPIPSDLRDTAEQDNPPL